MHPRMTPEFHPGPGTRAAGTLSTMRGLTKLEMNVCTIDRIEA